jgi:hypothetical protein
MTVKELIERLSKFDGKLTVEHMGYQDDDITDVHWQEGEQVVYIF